MCVRMQKLNRMHLVNWICQILFDLMFVWLTNGWWSLAWLLVSVLMAGTLNPLSGHFISEHYVLERDVSSYSDIKKEEQET